MRLSEDDKLVILGEGIYSRERSMLNDLHIYEFNDILKQHTSFNMQSTLLIQHTEFITPIPIDKEHIQILFSGNSETGHCITIYKNNLSIHIFDRSNSNRLNNEHILFIGSLFPYYSQCILFLKKCNRKLIHMIVEFLQLQM